VSEFCGIRLSIKRFSEDEQGAILVIVSIILMVLVFFVIGFAVDMARIKSAAIDLRAKTDIICKAAARDPLRQRATVNSFARQVGALISQDSLLYGMEIERATIVVPGTSGAAAVVDSDGELNIGHVDCEQCFYAASIASNVAGRFPPTMWGDQDLAAGNVVACELQATVSGFMPNLGSFLGGEQTVVARSAWGRGVASASPFTYFDFEAENVQATQMPGLSIGIATQLTTRSTERFRFSGAESVLADFDPLASTSLPFNSGSESHEYDSEHETAVIPAVNDQDDSDELLIACMNPAVLARNIFLSTIVELSSRHGQLRDSTEIISINSRDRSRSAEFDYVAPALISRFGEDIAGRNFQHPFVFYPAGRPGNFPNDANFGQPKGFQDHPGPGMLINPFDYPLAAEHPFLWDDETMENLLEHHALVASQLRLCNRLYSTSTGQLARYPLDEIESSADGFLSASVAGFAAPGSLSWPGSSADYWDLEDPWHSCDGERPCLTAGEVVATLGVSQSCPFEQGGLPGFIFYEPVGVSGYHGRCMKPFGEPLEGIGSHDLEPDLTSFLRYLGSDDPGVGTLPGYSALNSPGIAALDLNTSEDPPELFDSIHPHEITRYNDPSNKNIYSHILLVLHQPIRSLEVGAMRQLVNDLSVEAGARRPITVVYLPTTLRDATAGWVFQNFRTAFDLTEDFGLGDSDPQRNRLYVFSPFEEIHSVDGDACITTVEPFCIGAAPTSDSDADELFRDYWEWLATPGHRFSMERRAREIFLERLLEQRFRM